MSAGPPGAVPGGALGSALGTILQAESISLRTGTLSRSPLICCRQRAGMGYG
jgi:hypothetical protein